MAKFQTAQLVECLLSEDTQVQLPSESEEVVATLTAAQVAKIFTNNVPGVQRFLFRGQQGQCVLKFLQIAYKDGWSVFRGTPLQDHLKWLMRLVVHYGHEGKPGAAQYLTEVAEAFMDCQAVQARVVERIGLKIRGVTTNFRGLVVGLVGEYKTWAVKMLAAERVAQGKAQDDATPTHYENRLTADLGFQLGLNASDVRRAELDEHARSRFPELKAHEMNAAAARARELFDVEALLHALVSELNSFSATSGPESLPKLFLDWASENMAEKHVVFDEETCTRVEVDCMLAMAVLEFVFLGQVGSLANETYRDTTIRDLFESAEVHETLATNAPSCSSNEEEKEESAENNEFCSSNETDTNEAAENNASTCMSNVVEAEQVLAITSSNSKVCSAAKMSLFAIISEFSSPLNFINMLGSLYDAVFQALLPSEHVEVNA